jgi:hypothetical protein
MKFLKILLVLVLLLAVAGYFGYRFVNKTSADLSDKKPEATYTLVDLIEKSSDTTSLYQFKDKLIAVTGNVKKISKEANRVTLELGDSTTVSSVICQIDDRHVTDFSDLKENTNVSVKGLLRSVDMDESGLGLGNTVQLNYCVKN